MLGPQELSEEPSTPARRNSGLCKSLLLKESCCDVKAPERMRMNIYFLVLALCSLESKGSPTAEAMQYTELVLYARLQYLYGKKMEKAFDHKALTSLLLQRFRY